jgi:hypothetical protein
MKGLPTEIKKAELKRGYKCVILHRQTDDNEMERQKYLSYECHP